MNWLARIAVRRPIIALSLAVIVIGALGLVGLGVSSSVSPTVTVVPGTQASRAQHLAEAQFGPSVLVPILLEGPARSLDRQGPALVRALDRRGDTRVLSAWDGGAQGAQLRPRPTAAMIVAAVAQSEKRMADHGQGQIDRLVARTISGPVHASITGQPSIDRAMRNQAIDTTRRTIAIALPILLLVLILVLRAPIVALLIALLSAGTAYGALGLTALLAKAMDVDPIAVLLGTMTGLVLASGYGVLVARSWAGAAPQALRAAGRGVLIGGTALIIANLVADALGPTKVLSSLFLTSTLCGFLAIGAAVVVMPAALTLLGARAHWLVFPPPRPLARVWTRLAGGGGSFVVRDAVGVGAVATVVLALLAIPAATSLKTGPPSARYLPPDDPARVSFERVAQVMGPGWPTPFNIVLVAKGRPVTDRALLLQLNAFQRSLARDKRVASVVGPGAFAATSTDLNALPKSLKSSTKLLKTGKRDLGKLAAGLGQAGAGVKRLRAGLTSAAAGAGQLQGGSGDAQAGAGKLRAGLTAARTGAAQITAGLNTALSGAERLRTGSAAALKGSKQISGGLGQAVGPVKTGAPVVKQLAANVAASAAAAKTQSATAQSLTAQLDQAATALRALPESAQKTDALGAVSTARDASANLAGALSSQSEKIAGQAGVANAFAGQVATLSKGLAQLYAGSTALTSGISKLQSGNASLASGIGKLASGGGQLTTGVTALRNGASQLESGLGQLTNGAGQLATGLSSGVGPSGKLATGLGTAQSSVTKFRSSLPSAKDLERLQRQSPGLFDSGYFVLAAIAGAPPTQRTQASFAVNLTRGGRAGQITVISRYAADDDRTVALGDDLVTRTDRFAKASGTEAAVGGPAGALGDFGQAATDKLWIVVAGVALVVLLFLMIMLRAVAMPLAAVAFDLLGVAATIGIMALLFCGDDPLLGGPGYIDPMTIIAVFTATFGLTIVYEVQLLVAARDRFAATGDAKGALRFGLDRTAAATTGAALAMVAAIIPFAAGDLVAARQLGVAALIVIVLDALVIRPVLLPAAIAVLGPRGWWPTHGTPAARPRPARPAGPAPTPARPTTS